LNVAYILSLLCVDSEVTRSIDFGELEILRVDFVDGSPKSASEVK